MKMHAWVALTVLVSADVAYAGAAGAGPGGTGSLAVGTVITTDTIAGAMFGTILPGTVGSVRLTAEQVAALSVYLAEQPGAVVRGSTITVEASLANGGRGRLTLDIAARTLTVARL